MFKLNRLLLCMMVVTVKDQLNWYEKDRCQDEQD